MKKEKMIVITEEEITSTDETLNSTEKTADNYEVGYGRPPKDTRFRKGVSGNPSGRTRKPQDFDQQLLREAGSFVTITEKGRRVRISKHDVAIRQLVHKAMTGDLSALKTFVPLCRLAREKVVLMEAQKVKDLERYNDVTQLTTEELERLLATILEREEKDRKK